MPHEAEPGSRKIDSEDAPDEVPVRIGPVTGKFLNIPKILKQLRKDPEKFEVELEKARARHRAKHQGISP